MIVRNRTVLSWTPSWMRSITVSVIRYCLCPLPCPRSVFVWGRGEVGVTRNTGWLHLSTWKGNFHRQPAAPGPLKFEWLPVDSWCTQVWVFTSVLLGVRNSGCNSLGTLPICTQPHTPHPPRSPTPTWETVCRVCFCPSEKARRPVVELFVGSVVWLGVQAYVGKTQ